MPRHAWQPARLASDSRRRPGSRLRLLPMKAPLRAYTWRDAYGLWTPEAGSRIRVLARSVDEARLALAVSAPWERLTARQSAEVRAALAAEPVLEEDG